MVVLTVGKSYIDIDGYASSIAYRELLTMQGISAKFVSNAVTNSSVTKSLLNLPYGIDEYKVKSDDKFILLDFSNPNFIPEFVDEGKVIEVIDHHPGYEDYWDNSVIEEIGAVATIIVERYQESGLLNKMKKEIALLLMAAILDNTLNFTAKITSERDKEAYKLLQNISKEYNYTEKYFLECQKCIEADLKTSINNDIKIEYVNDIIPDVFGQLTIWDSKKILDNKSEIYSIMNSYGDKWIINIISLKDNSSFIFCSDFIVKSKLEKLFNCRGEDYLIIKPALVRKEVMKKAKEVI